MENVSGYFVRWLTWFADLQGELFALAPDSAMAEACRAEMDSLTKRMSADELAAVNKIQAAVIEIGEASDGR